MPLFLRKLGKYYYESAKFQDGKATLMLNFVHGCKNTCDFCVSLTALLEGNVGLGGQAGCGFKGQSAGVFDEESVFEVLGRSQLCSLGRLADLLKFL